MCSACCADYIADGAACDKCVLEKCSHSCQPATCNVCSKCCADYIPDGAACDKCVEEQCPASLPFGKIDALDANERKSKI